MKTSQPTIRIQYIGLATEELVRLLKRGELDSLDRSEIATILLERGAPEDEWDAILEKADQEKDGIPGLAALDARLIANVFDVFLSGTLLVVGPQLGSPLVALTSVAISIGYLLLRDGMRNGQSIGKRIVGISVVDRDSRHPIGKGSSFLRNMTVILGPFDLVFALGKNRQKLGDIFANTIVIDAPEN